VAAAAWTPGTAFHMGEAAGRPCLLDPRGQPYKSVGMVWAYGPERGPLQAALTPERVITHLKIMKALGFNTLNLYGDRFVPEMLEWCDDHEMAVYFRTCYFPPDYPKALREYPDYMDPELRRAAKDHYEKLLREIEGHPSVLAIDMHHSWMFPLEWNGAVRFDRPMLREKSVAYLPQWLNDQYGAVSNMNRQLGTSYTSFRHVLQDTELLQNGSFRSLSNHPLRKDIVNYTLWTEQDFIQDLTAHIHTQSTVMVTLTTEHPECIPEFNPPPETGVAFMSPVHYNGIADFIRDPYGLCKLIYETRWHYDLQGRPAYISETGWRTSVLGQDPFNRDYAWLIPPTEENMARAYAEQFALMNVLPWISGYGYFKLYDKPVEGDFGYLRDTGEKKPLAYIGDAINEAFETAALPDIEPEVWIYYPEYALASHRPGFQQFKTWVACYEQPFLQALSNRVDQYWNGLRDGNAEAGSAFAQALTADFTNLWRGFAFTPTIPEDDKPILLFSTVSEILSADDREALKAKKTLCFGPAGSRDTAMRPTTPWMLEMAGLDPREVREQWYTLHLTHGDCTRMEQPPPTASGLDVWKSMTTTAAPASVKCSGQTLHVGGKNGKRLEFLASSSNGNAAPNLTLKYTNGRILTPAMAPTITDADYPAVMTHGVLWSNIYMSRIIIKLEPAWALEEIVLPDAPWVNLHAAAITAGGAAEDVLVELSFEEAIRQGRTPWMLYLPEQVPEPVSWNVLHRDPQGNPLVVARDAHIFFLYDPLTWTHHPGEISRFVTLHRLWIDQALDYLNGDTP
jgi:hypothetical protein